MAWGLGNMEEAMRQVGGGIWVAVGLIAGTIIGSLFGESTLGLLGGLVLGLAAAGLVALRDNRRR